MQGKISFRFGPKSRYALILVLIFALAFLIRVIPRLEDVFGTGWVKFAETDPWYHIRLLENLLHHFPQGILFDPYTLFPYGRDVFFAPMFDRILGFFIWVIGLGSPTEHTMQIVAAYFPPILGALTIVPVFFIGKELFNKKAGVICAALAAVMPGNFLARSLLGVTDHHVAEYLFSTVAALFLIMAIKRARDRDIRFSDILRGDWKRFRLPLIYALLSGLFLAAYILSWVGGLLFIFIIFIFLIIQFVIDHLRGKSTEYLGIVGVPLFLLAMVLILPFMNQSSMTAAHPASLALGAIVAAALAGLSGWMAGRKLKRVYFPLALVVLGLAAAGIFNAVAHSLMVLMVNNFNIFFPQGGVMTITEVQPLFHNFGQTPLFQSRVWGFFTTGLFILPVSIILLVYSSVKETRAEIIFFLTWSVLMIAATLGQNRFSYYLAINVALAGGYFFWRIIVWISWAFEKMGFRESRPATTVSVTHKKKGKAKKAVEHTGPAAGYRGARYAAITLAAIVGFFLVFFPNITQDTTVYKGVPAPDNDWHESLLWMRNNTPEPFSDPDFYYAQYDKPAPGHPYSYPASAYGVMSWWDYGHWITEIAHRIPNSNAFQDGAVEAAIYFTRPAEGDANGIMDRLGSKYVIIDRAMATTKIWAMTDWIHMAQTAEYYYQRNSAGRLDRVLLYYPEYYRTMVARLYNFEGKAVVPYNTTTVISYTEKKDNNGTPYKEITSSKVFPTYEEGLKFLQGQKTTNYRLVGADPFASPVPLEASAHYRLVHQSPSILGEGDNRKVTYVEIFEYNP
jgi:dolichyl-phosphooligosaccharide-protein glycotransferase